jgi:hypothetical protein
MNGEWIGKDLKEMAMAYFGVLLQHLREETENTYEAVRTASSPTGIRTVNSRRMQAKSVSATQTCSLSFSKDLPDPLRP